MKDITKTIIDLATFNSWRRGDESIEMPSPMEIGWTIDSAVNIMRDHRQLLKDYDELKQKHDELKRRYEAVKPKCEYCKGEQFVPSDEGDVPCSECKLPSY